VARLLGDEREREQLEVALREHVAHAEPIAASASAASPPASRAFALMAAEAPGGP
jgi:hypothetical protein